MTKDRKTRARRNLYLLHISALFALAFAAFFAQPRGARAQTSTLSNGLVSHWKLEEPSGSRADSVGTNELADNNGVGQAQGKLGQAAQFSAPSGEYLVKPDNTDFSIQPNVSFTFAGWFNLASKTTYMGLFSKDEAAGVREYVLYYDHGMDRFVWMVFGPNGADPIIATTLGSPQVNQWYFIAVWHDATAGTIGIQINNGTADSKAHAGGITDNVSAFRLGMGLANGAPFNGSIDSFSFWKRSLTAAERTELWNNGAGKDPTGGSTTPPSSGGSQWVTTPEGDIYFNAGKVGIGLTNPQRALDVVGDLNATGTITGGNVVAKYQDVAEWVPSTQKLPAGTVVILDAARTNHVRASLKAYDTSVAGVISEMPGVILGEGGEGKLMVATTGRVKIKVDATRGPIRVGDLLVTSDVEGVAMKSAPLKVGGAAIHRPGTIIGKALEPFEKGTGEILVLLSLQ